MYLLDTNVISKLRKAIPFNKPCMTGKELWGNGHLAGDGSFTKQCQTLWTLLMFEAFLRRMESDEPANGQSV